jgi:hypothetical protein
MFWNIFFDSLIFIIGILVAGWIIANLIGRRKKTGTEQEP